MSSSDVLAREPTHTLEFTVARTPAGLGLGLSDVHIGSTVQFNRVTAVAAGSAAEEAGIKLMDRITAVDGADATGGPAGPLIAGKATVKLTVARTQLTEAEHSDLLATCRADLHDPKDDSLFSISGSLLGSAESVLNADL